MHRIRSWARHKAHASNYNPFGPDQHPAIPLTNTSKINDGISAAPRDVSSKSKTVASSSVTSSTGNTVSGATSTTLPPPAPPPTDLAGDQQTSSALAPEKPPQSVFVRFYNTSRMIVFSSWVNLLLVFVPVGIITNFTNVNPSVVFAMNAIAIVPLASLLGYSTESVARRMGDTVGALMNVTFGNAVELIILYHVCDPHQQDSDHEATAQSPHHSIASQVEQLLLDSLIALVKNEIRIVQASLLGSILSNLLLILGMCFLIGGLRYREQIYNSTVTQMSACLLSLSVMSLLLPTAFHASFTDLVAADKAVLQVSRGTSVILLLVYGLYLLFQLKSHAYMYESTPQHIIDEESRPGVLADIMRPGSSSDSSSSSTSDDTDDTSGSNTTARRIRRVIRKGRRRRKSNASSKDGAVITPATRSESAGSVLNTDSVAPEEIKTAGMIGGSHQLGAIASGDEADADEITRNVPRNSHDKVVKVRDFEKPVTRSRSQRHQRKTKRKHHYTAGNGDPNATASTVQSNQSISAPANQLPIPSLQVPNPAFGDDTRQGAAVIPKRPFDIRHLSFRPAMPRAFSGAVPPPHGGPGTAAQPHHTAPHGLRRSSSLPGTLNQHYLRPSVSHSHAPQPFPYVNPVNASRISLASADTAGEKNNISKTTAVILLLVSTGLVAVCAEALVGSIGYIVSTTEISEAFVGLILLPLVSNAAEHVTAVTVAAKNKMDLAIGVAVGSSIQIALFVTPIVVLLGWILDKDMSLFFSLFETVSLFVSAFIVNFLVLDGRSNYLEGALLCAAYVIIGVAAFFYPDSAQQVENTAPDTVRALLRL
ncbi:MAG: hypothetical protein M1817_000408 [Caeruleum heppii]|nr:MAG: hypothetical protein M1817_000408 [Caeruleum heppii]